MNQNVFESCPEYLGALTWNHPCTQQTLSLICDGIGPKSFPDITMARKQNTPGKLKKKNVFLFGTRHKKVSVKCSPVDTS